LKTIVIKCGGSTINQLSPSFFSEVVKMKSEGVIQPVIVHGGGPAISELLATLNVETTFINGLRKTTAPVLEVAEMILSGSLNKKVVRELIKAGGMAVGLSGVDGMLLQAEPIANAEELGLVGEIICVNKEFLTTLFKQNMIPVISPVAVDRNGQHYNINADLAAAAIANKLNGSLYLVTDVDGVMIEGKVANQLSNVDISSLIEDKSITGGMIPKVTAAINCLHQGVSEVAIFNGSKENALYSLANGQSKIGTKLFLEEVMKQSV
jgi:acetylglutamate kinase